MVESTLRQGGFERVREGSVAAVAWFESGKEAARRVCETLGMMIGEGWGVEEMEVGFRDMIAEGGGGVLKGKREEGREGWVGFEGEAWTGVGWK